MKFRPIRTLTLLLSAALLAACTGAGSANLPTAAPATAAPAPTARPAATRAPAPAATEAPAPTESAAATEVAATAEPVPAAPTAAPLPMATGQVVLQLSAGDQIGVTSADGTLRGPRSFRIGADGSIRLLDNLNKRVLFFDQRGKLARTFPIAAAQDPQDFIVNNAGEVFVFDQGGSQVLRYGPQGQVTATIPLSPGVSASADGIMLTAGQDLMLVQGNQSFWVLVHQGATVPPELQPLTQRAGAVTPRSPVVFQTSVADSQAAYLHVIGLRSGASGDMVSDVDGVLTQLPGDAQFFNVDRAMNLYFTRSVPDAEAVDLWRVRPDGTADGGARIVTGACGTSWRSLYVDQAGAAWTMCVAESGVTITQYPLLAPDGSALPAIAQNAAEVTWRPGARLDAA